MLHSMNDYYNAQVEQLHVKLARLYREDPGNKYAIEALWARIERLEDFGVRITVKEAGFGQL